MMVQIKMEVNMKALILAIPLAFVIGCGDKDEDTGEDTAVEVEESEEAEDSGDSEDLEEGDE